MKKIKRGLINVLLLLLAACMLFTGCKPAPDNGDTTLNNGGEGNGGNNDVGNQNTGGNENGGETNESQGLESGFNNEGSSCESSIFRCAYKSEKSEFEIDDVTLEFFYGGDYILVAEGEYIYGAEYIREKCGQDIPIFDLYFKEYGGEKILVKHVEENFISDKYNVEIDYYGNNPPKYSFSETLTIPKQLFSNERGMILFEIHGTNIKEGDDARYRPFTWTYIYYKKNNGKVILSDKEFK